VTVNPLAPIRIASPHPVRSTADSVPPPGPVDVVQVQAAAAPEPEVAAASHRGAALALLALTIATPLAAHLAHAQPLVPSASISKSMVVPTEEVDMGEPVQHRTSYTYNQIEIASGDEEALERAARLIGDADRTVRLEASSFHGAEAERLAQAMEERAGKGKQVYLLVDPSESSPLLDRLSRAGVTVRKYDTSHLALLGLGSKDNANLLIVDDNVAMSGSMRWDGERSQSYSVVTRGPAVGDLRHLWNESWGEVQPFDPGPPVAITPNALVRVLSNDPARQETKEALLAHIAVAKSEIFIEAFALDDSDVVQALKLARDRGVDVNVLLNKGSSDFARFNGDYNNLGAGIAFSEPNDAVSFRWFPSTRERKLRSMVAMFDRETAIIANSHWTGRDAKRQHSVDLLVHGKAEISAMKWQLVGDWQGEGVFAPVETPPETFHK